MANSIGAEDNSFLANAVIEKISFFKDLKFKFKASNGAELIGKLEENHNVDIILMDIQIPVMDAIKAGASGYLLKKNSSIPVSLRC